ncbi:signal peptidase I [Candidatus Roizmanbacteria bacterium]|nr:signal peptidase I [Candidatus Roizmanbacteria bacterium]
MTDFIKKNRRKRFFVKAEGNSMLPLLKSGDIVYYEKIKFEHIKIDDLVLFYKKDQYFTHRVIYKTKKYLITKGDNNLISDGKIYPDKVMARVVDIKRNGQIFNVENLYLIQSSFYMAELSDLCEKLTDRGIEYAIIKGLPLHLYYEKHHPRRIYADCDFLIRKSQFSDFDRLLKDKGFVMVDGGLLLPVFERIKQAKDDLIYTKKHGRFDIVLDVHFEPEFTNTRIGNIEAFYPGELLKSLSQKFLSSKKKITINDNDFFILDDDVLIIYLLLHLFNHGFKGTYRINFIDRVIRKNRLGKNGWLKVLAFIEEYRLNNFVGPGFALLKKYYQTPIPDFFLKKLSTPPGLLKTVSKTNIYINYRAPDEILKNSLGERFWTLFRFSPQPLWKKITAFSDIKSILAGIFTVGVRAWYYLNYRMTKKK